MRYRVSLRTGNIERLRHRPLAEQRVLGADRAKCGVPSALRSDCFTAERCAYGFEYNGAAVSQANVSIGARDGARVVGVLLAQPSRGELFVHSVCVAHTHRRAGVGKALFGALARLFPRARVTLRVALPQRCGDPDAADLELARRVPLLLKFYASLGFRPVARGEYLTLRCDALRPV